jgi:hypothetical protein
MVREEAEMRTESMEPKGASDGYGNKRREGRCALCGQRVWWCLSPPEPYMALPFEDNGDHHWWKCEEGLKIEDKVERTIQMMGEKDTSQTIEAK